MGRWTKCFLIFSAALVENTLMIIDDGMDERLLAKSPAKEVRGDVKHWDEDTRSKTYSGSSR